MNETLLRYSRLTRIHERKKLLSTIPVNVEKVLNYSSNDCRSERALEKKPSVAEDERKSETAQRVNKISKNIRETGTAKSSNNVSTPHSNLSYATLKSIDSSLSKTKVLTSQGAQKLVPNKKISQLSKLAVGSNILNNICKNQLAKPNTRLAEVSTLSQQTPSKEKNKLFNIALNSAKNVNMYEINNYFHSPNGLKEDEKSVSNSSMSKSVASKRLQSRVQELTKAKAIAKDPAELCEPRPPTSLQNKLQAMTHISKNRLTLNK